jgi:hypothetical protein
VFDQFDYVFDFEPTTDREEGAERTESAYFWKT